jgi:hypothetical protein
MRQWRLRERAILITKGLEQHFRVTQGVKEGPVDKGLGVLEVTLRVEIHSKVESIRKLMFAGMVDLILELL